MDEMRSYKEGMMDGMIRVQWTLAWESMGRGIRNKVCGPEGYLHENEPKSKGYGMRSKKLYEK